jgi:hypothetical protein
MKKIVLFTAAALLASTSLTLAQQPAAKPGLSVMDMLKSQKKSSPTVAPVQPQPVAAPAPMPPVVQKPIVQQPIVAQPAAPQPPAPIPPIMQTPPAPVVAPPVAEIIPPALPSPETAPPSAELAVTPESQLPVMEAGADQQLALVPVEEKDVAPATDEYGVPKDVRKSLENDFNDKLKFPLTQEKMVAYIRATAKVEAINSRWDVEVAAAATDQVAMENNNFAVEDITATLSNMKELTIGEYNELTALAAKNNSFANLVYIYRDLVKSGAFKRQPMSAVPDPKIAERMKAVQERIDSMKAELQALRAAPPIIAAPAQADPLLTAQLDALTAKAQQIADRINAINQRAASIEKQVKTN